jgi:carbonic anhydrase/acetyltransferase-like protein (isoleucine patch superfamily)
MIISYNGKSPRIAEGCFLAPDCVIIGDVAIGSECSIWFKSVLRGDINWIKIGNWTNIQDGCVIHVTGGTAPTEVGDYVTIGHSAVLHGCTIESGSLIGMGSIILDNAVVGEGSLVAAGAVVRSGMKIPPHTMVAGNPAEVKRKVSSDEREYFIKWAKNYCGYSKQYQL